MNRKALTLLATAALATLSFLICYATATWVRRGMAPQDDLVWLQSEFGLSGDEMSRMRKLHEGYLPECRQRCALIAAKDQEISRLLNSASTVTLDLQQKLQEAAALRAECQTAMLRHFYDVSREMPPEQGRRYLEQMQKLTLDLHSGQSHGMPGMDASTHGHH